jgi:hypothetical protein
MEVFELVEGIVFLDDEVVVVIFLDEGVSDVFSEAYESEFVGGGGVIAIVLFDDVMAEGEVEKDEVHDGVGLAFKFYFGLEVLEEAFFLLEIEVYVLVIFFYE